MAGIRSAAYHHTWPIALLEPVTDTYGTVNIGYGLTKQHILA